MENKKTSFFGGGHIMRWMTLFVTCIFSVAEFICEVTVLIIKLGLREA